MEAAPETAELADPPLRDESWFNTLFADYAATIVRYFIRRISDRHDADDLAAEVFATAWRRRETIVDKVELAWLYRTAGYVLANYRRATNANPIQHLETLIDSYGDGVHTLAAEDCTDLVVIERDLALRALAALSCRDRDIIELAAWDGLNRQALADYLGISLGGADAALSRARTRLVEELQNLSR